MRSLIIIEVEHDETTDDVQAFVENVDATRYLNGLNVNGITVRVDLPSCFVLDT